MRYLVHVSILSLVAIALSSRPKYSTAAPPVVAPPTQPTGNIDALSVDNLFGLVGQAGLPAFLKSDASSIATSDGLSKGDIRTVETDFYNKDFTLDLEFQFSVAKGRKSSFVGIGDDTRDGNNRSTDQTMCVEIQSDGESGTVSVVASHDIKRSQIVKLLSAGPHLLRMEKKGDALTFSVTGNFSGRFVPDSSSTITGFQKSASFLTRLNSPLFFFGDIPFKAVRLQVDGKIVDPGKALSAAPINPESHEGFARFGPTVPNYLTGPQDLLVTSNGQELGDGTILRTRDGDFITKDFTFDVIYHFKPDSGSTLLIGVGDDGHRDDSDSTIAGVLRGPKQQGLVSFGTRKGGLSSFNEKLGEQHAIGPNMARLQKRGNALTLAVCADYKGKFDPDFVVTMPDLRHAAPNLTAKNSFLFLGHGGIIDQTRLLVDGVVNSPSAGGANEANAAHGGVDEPATKPSIARLGRDRPLPRSFHHTPETLSNNDGLLGGIVSTINSIPTNEDFIFDVLFKFNDKDGELRAGYGDEKMQNWAWKAAMIKVLSPGKGQRAEISQGDRGADAGTLAGELGPNLLRITKHANALTFSITENYTDHLDPILERSIPDITPDQTFLKLASRLFVEGENITVMGLGLTVNGKLIAGAAPPTAETLTGPGNPANVGSAPTGTQQHVEGNIASDPSGANGAATRPARRQSSIKALYIQEQDNGVRLGMASDLIITVMPGPADGDALDAGFGTPIGPEMKLVLDDVMRYVSVRYPRINGVKVEFTFEDKYTGHDGGSIGAALGTLIRSIFEGYGVDPQLAITGDVSAEGKVHAIGGLAAKLRGAKAANCTVVAIPDENFEQLVDTMIYSGVPAIYDVQVIGISTLDDAVAVAHTDRQANMAKGIELFAAIQQELQKSPNYIHEKDAQDKLQKVLELIPSHLSAKLLLQVVQNKQRHRLTAGASEYYAFAALSSVAPALAENDFVGAGKSVPTVITQALTTLQRLRPIADSQIQPLIDTCSNLIQTRSDYDQRRASDNMLRQKYRAFTDELSKLSADTKLMEKMLHEGV